MRYSFESWAGMNGNAASSASGQSFPFTEDLQELEESLSMRFGEVMGNYRREAEMAEDTAEASDPTLADNARWDELAQQVAEHVLSYLSEVQHPLRKELEKTRLEADEYYRDNKAMAAQIRQLMAEKEHLQRALSLYEFEVARYRGVLGNLYVKL